MLESRRNLALACALSALAGYVDAIGYLQLGGLFVSFMSGNSTRLGVTLAEGHWQHALEALALIVLFVVGAAAGSLIVLSRFAHRQPLILLVEALLLAAAALAYANGLPNTAVAAIVPPQIRLVPPLPPPLLRPSMPPVERTQSNTQA